MALYSWLAVPCARLLQVLPLLCSRSLSKNRSLVVIWFTWSFILLLSAASVSAGYCPTVSTKPDLGATSFDGLLTNV